MSLPEFIPERCCLDAQQGKSCSPDSQQGNVSSLDFISLSSVSAFLLFCRGRGLHASQFTRYAATGRCRAFFVDFANLWWSF